MNNYQKYFKSQVMILVVVLMTTIFALAISSQMSFLLSLRQSRLAIDSVKAFYAADSGVEWKMYEFFIGDISEPTLTNETSCCGEDISITTPSDIGIKFRIISTGTSPATSTEVQKVKRTINSDLL